MRSLPGRSSSSGATVSMATRLATSPAAWPPIPSATASSRGPAYMASSLIARSSPTSLRAPNRRPRLMWCASLAELQHRLADADLGAERHGNGIGDALPAEVGPVRRAEILEDPLVVAGDEP